LKLVKEIAEIILHSFILLFTYNISMSLINPLFVSCYPKKGMRFAFRTNFK